MTRRARLFQGGESHAPKSVAKSVDILLEHIGAEGDSLNRKIFGGLPESVRVDGAFKANGDFTIGFKKHVVAVILRALRVVEQERDRINAERRSFTLSNEWRELRYRVLARRGGRCECCGASAADGKKMHVDHIRPRSKFPELALDESNLQVLCEDCNVGKSNKDETDWRVEVVQCVVSPSVKPENFKN